MELRVKPKDKMYKDLKYLIENDPVKINMAKILTNPDTFRREDTYRTLYNLGFLERVGKLNVYYIPGKYGLLEDKTIVLHDRLYSVSLKSE